MPRIHQTRIALLIALLALLALPVTAQVSDIVEINPDFSNLGGSNEANGGSGGRVNQLAVDPSNANVLYAASEWGGLFKSTDGGLTWNRLDGHRPVATWDVEVKPGQTNIVIATSFYDGKSSGLSQSGINRSSDSGATWTRQTNLPPNGFCANGNDENELSAFGIAFDPDLPNSNVYVGTSCGLAVSTNNGANWTYRRPPMGGAPRIWDVVVSSDGTKVDTCGDAGHWRYFPGGNTWQQGTGIISGRCSLANSPYDDDNLFAAVGFSIFETEDGQNWQQTRINPLPIGRIPFVATNKRSFAPVGRSFQLWFGDKRVFAVDCDTDASPSCGTGDTPRWKGAAGVNSGAHDDAGDVVFDPSPPGGNDACPLAVSSDGGVYVNIFSTLPDCQPGKNRPLWQEPNVTPHALWPMGMSGVNQPGPSAEDLYIASWDNGMWGALDAGATPPTWDNATPLRSVDATADESDGSIVYSRCCFPGQRTRIFKQGAGFTGAGSGQIPDTQLPPGIVPEEKYIDAIARWGVDKYVMVTHDQGGGYLPDGGVYSTFDIEAPIIAWRSVHLNASGTPPPTDKICGVKVAVANGDPTFFVQTGGCTADTTTDRLFKYTGGSPPGGTMGTWTEIVLPQGGIGVFDVQQNDPNHLIAFGFTASDAFAYRSTNGGSTWSPLPALKLAMVDGGNFPMKNERGPTDFTSFNGYHQPSLVAIDPTNPKILVAGGRDAGVFLSTDSGSSWTRFTDPLSSNTSGVPHIPRPRFAYFDQESGAKSIFIGSQGRGIWRVELESNCPANVTLSNMSLAGTQTFGAAQTLTTGPALEIAAGADITLEAGQYVEMLNGTSVVGELTVNTGGITFCQGPTPSVPIRERLRGPRAD